jgi:hypothetical protein
MGVSPATIDRSTMGQPAKYMGFHFVENEEDFPSLAPLHVELGFQREQSVATVFHALTCVQLYADFANSAEALADSVAAQMAHIGIFTVEGFCGLVIPPQCAALLVSDGWSKADFRTAVYERTLRSWDWLRENGLSTIEYQFFGVPANLRLAARPPFGEDPRTPAVAANPDRILVLIAGADAGAYPSYILPYATDFDPFSNVIEGGLDS